MKTSRIIMLTPVVVFIVLLVASGPIASAIARTGATNVLAAFNTITGALNLLSLIAIPICFVMGLMMEKGQKK